MRTRDPAGQASGASAIYAAIFLVDQAVNDAIGFVEAAADNIEILRVTTFVAPEHRIGDVIGELDET